MEQYLIDTNVVCDYFSASLPANGIRFMDAIIDAVPKLSIITEIELLYWKTDKQTEQKVKEFISDSLIMNIAPKVISNCVSIRKSKKIKTPDAIIAATALANNYSLITNNEKDLKKIKGLKVINPHNLKVTDL